MTRDYKLFIEDVLNAISNIEKFTEGIDYGEFLKDEKTKGAVVWQIHVIGEAVKNIPKLTRDRFKDVPWKYMAKIRDKIAHFYFGIDYEIVWDVAKRKLPDIKPNIEKILSRLK